MKRFSYVFLCLVGLWTVYPCSFGRTQTVSQPSSLTSVTPLASPVKSPAPENQWVSHQMNQPPPETGDKYSFSPGLVDEIKELYIQAKKEYEAKAANRPQAKKLHPSKTDKTVSGTNTR